MPVASVPPVQALSGPPPADKSAPAAPGATEPTATVSPSGLLMSRLQRLAQQDPAKLAVIADQASQTLRSSAGATTGDTARSLNRLADGFAQVASTGNVSNVVLGSASRPRHPHHAGAGAKSYSGPSSSMVPQTAAAKLEAISLQVEQALGLSPPPLGPWGNEQ